MIEVHKMGDLVKDTVTGEEGYVTAYHPALVRVDGMTNGVPWSRWKIAERFIKKTSATE